MEILHILRMDDGGEGTIDWARAKTHGSLKIHPSERAGPFRFGNVDARRASPTLRTLPWPYPYQLLHALRTS